MFGKLTLTCRTLPAGASGCRFLPSLPTAHSPSYQRTPLLAAFHLWSNADFAGCLAEIGSITPQLGRHERFEARALRARCYLRLDRPGDALDVLGFESDSPADPDGSCTYASLRGLAMLSTGRHRLGLDMLCTAVSQTEERGVSEAVRWESSYNLAFGHWTRGNYDEAEAIATAIASTATDTIAARSVALRGWIRIARAQFREALDFFRRSLRIYGASSIRDAAFHASVVHALAVHELLVLDHAEPFQYAPMLPRVQGASLDTYRLLVGCVDAIRFALAGDEAAAIESAVSTEILDVDARWRVWGIALRARLASSFGHEHFGRAAARAAATLAAELDWNSAPADSRLGLLDVAEVLSRYDRERARALLMVYDRIQTELGTRYRRSASPVVRARELHAKGVVALAQGNAEGTGMLLEAAELYSLLEFHWRAAESRLALHAGENSVALDAKAMGRAFVEQRFPQSHLAREAPNFAPRIVIDPSMNLTPAQVEIARHLCAGRSAREIAVLRGTSLGTVYNQLKDLYRRTELRSIGDIKRVFGAGDGSRLVRDLVVDPPLR